MISIKMYGFSDLVARVHEIRNNLFSVQKQIEKTKNTDDVIEKLQYDKIVLTRQIESLTNVIEQHHNQIVALQEQINNI